jgi:hypothetical protein
VGEGPSEHDTGQRAHTIGRPANTDGVGSLEYPAHAPPPGIPLDVQRSQLESAQEIAWSHSQPATRANAPREEKPRGSLSARNAMMETIANILLVLSGALAAVSLLLVLLR